MGQLGGMIQSLGNIGEGDMGEEVLKAYPGSLNLEEKKGHAMQTRSKGPVSFGEKNRANTLSINLMVLSIYIMIINKRKVMLLLMLAADVICK